MFGQNYFLFLYVQIGFVLFVGCLIVDQIGLGNGEIFFVVIFGGGIWVVELKQGVDIFGYEIDFDVVDQG